MARSRYVAERDEPTRGFRPSPSGLGFSTLRGMHPQSAPVLENGARPGSLWDELTATEHDEVEIMFIGEHQYREFWKPREDAQLEALIDEHPEVGRVAGQMVCGSINGIIPTGGLYVGRNYCHQCPHASGACKQRHAMLVAIVGDDSGQPRSIPVHPGSSLPSQIRLNAKAHGVVEYGRVCRIKASVQKGNKGSYVEYAPVSYRDATDEEYEIADRMNAEIIEPYDELLHGDMQVFGVIEPPARKPAALPEASPSIQPGATVTRDDEPIEAGPAEDEEETPPPAPPRTQGGEQTKRFRPKTVPVNGSGGDE